MKRHMNIYYGDIGTHQVVPIIKALFNNYKYIRYWTKENYRYNKLLHINELS